MFKALIEIRFRSMFSGMFKGSKGKKNTTGKTVLFVILGIYILGCFGVLFGGMFASICEPFAAMGMSWLYFGYMGVMVFMLCFIGSVFVTQNQLYNATDNELLLSMPVPPKYILASRLVALVGLNYIYELLIIIPGAFVYVAKMPITIIGTLIFIVSFLLLPLLTITLSALFGWIIATINSKTGNKNIITLVLTVVLFLGYMYVCMRMQHYLNLLVSRGEEIGDAIRKVLPPFYYLGQSIVQGNLLYFIIFVLCCLVPFALVYAVLSGSFIKIATSSKNAKKIKYKEKALKVSGVRKALIIKESRHFLGNTMYMFNAGIGLVFMPIGAIYLVIKQDSIFTVLGYMGMDSSILGSLVCAGFGIMASMTIISAPTISIEGKTLWIAKSSPILEKDILLAKSDMHILMSLPFLLVSALIVEIGLELTLLSRILIVALPIAITVFNALIGIVLNLKFPKFDWINETAAVKQGMAPFLAMLVSFAMVIFPALLYVVVLNSVFTPDVYLGIVFVYYAILSLGAYLFIINKGIEIYRKLQN